jgi:uncharacterized membrane protein
MSNSKAAIFGHPLHPMLVPFPIAFLVGTLICDIVYASSGNPFWADVAKWLLVPALVGGALAAVLGLMDFASIRQAREGWIGWAHMGGNVIVMLLSAINLVLRWNDPAGAEGTGIIISVIVVCMLLVTGWLGGELVFRRHVGVVDSRAGHLHPAE